MTLTEVITKAIEGGYIDQALVDYCNNQKNDAPLLLDPLF